MHTHVACCACRYRGLKSFRTSPWDSKENLPLEYAKIFQFENFARTKKRVINAIDDVAGAMVRAVYEYERQWYEYEGQ